MNIPALTKPVLLYMDNKTMFQKLSTTSNTELIYNGGVIEMNSVTPEIEDGFQINLSFPGVNPKFNINDLPYIKVRYKISGIHENISGGAVANPWGSFQIYYGINNDTAVSLCRAFTPYTGTGHRDDDILEVIVNMKDIPQNDLEERVYIQNITQDTEKYIDFSTDRTECYDNTDEKTRTDTTQYSVMRFNFMRQSNLPRNAEVYYIGFFPSFEEAQAYDSDVEAEKRLDDAEEKLRNLGASGAAAIWGDVAKEKTEIANGQEITADMFDGTSKADLVHVEECQDAVFYQDEYRTDFTVVIHSVPTDNEYAMSRSIAARAYVDYTVDGGEVQRLYSHKTLSCSMDSLLNP